MGIHKDRDVYKRQAGYRQHEERDIHSYAQRIIDVKKQYEQNCTTALETAVSYAVEIGNRMSAIMVYDYSSSVEAFRSEEHTSELQSLRRISYAVFCLK